MSVRVLSYVWDHGPEDPSELLVLLALADFANDRGECWPAMDSVGTKSRMAERSARRVLRRLEGKGYVETVVGGGRHGVNQYRIVMKTRPQSPGIRAEETIENPDPASPGPTVPPDPDDAKPGPWRHKTRTLESAEPSGTVKNRQYSAQARDLLGEIDDPEVDRGPTFTAFWDRWPLGKISRKAAEKAFKRLSPADRRAATEAAPDWCKRWRAMYPTASPIHAATYLNGGKWTDEWPSAPRPAGQPKTNRERYASYR